MPDLSKWDIPAKIIAENRAEYFLSKHGESYNDIWKETMEDDYELKDWLANNMNWEDVSKFAEKVEEIRMAIEDLQEGIVNGEKEVIEK